MRDTIAFVSTYTHPGRDSTERAVRAAFPEYRFEVIAVSDLIHANRAWVAPNLLCTAREYWRDIVLRRASLRGRYFQTTYLFRKVRESMRQFIDPQRHVFSFQTHSLFDTSVPGVPHVVYTDHTHLSNLAVRDFDRRLLRPAAWIALEQTIYDNAAVIFTFSRDVAADLERLYHMPSDKVMCAYTGSNVEVLADDSRSDESYAARRVLFVGSDWERKGGPDLVNAFRRVLTVYPDAQLIIAGARPKLNLPNCQVLGHVPVEKLSPLFARASVFCMPTRLEPFGMAYLEAMTHRLPIVATRIGALPEIVEEGVTGNLVAPGDTRELAAALVRFLGDPARCRQFGEAGYRRAMQYYTWDQVGARMRARILPLIRAAARDARTRKEE